MELILRLDLAPADVMQRPGWQRSYGVATECLTAGDCVTKDWGGPSVSALRRPDAAAMCGVALCGATVGQPVVFDPTARLVHGAAGQLTGILFNDRLHLAAARLPS